MLAGGRNYCMICLSRPDWVPRPGGAPWVMSWSRPFGFSIWLNGAKFATLRHSRPQSMVSDRELSSSTKRTCAAPNVPTPKSTRVSNALKVQELHINLADDQVWPSDSHSKPIMGAQRLMSVPLVYKCSYQLNHDIAHFFLQRRFRCVAKADNGRRNFGTLDSGPFMGVDLHLSCILTFGFQEEVTSTKLVSRSNFIVGQQAKHVEHSWVAGSQESLGVIAPKRDERDAPSQIAAVLAGPSVAKSPPAPARFGTSTVLSLLFGWASAPEIVDGSSRSSSAVKEHNNSASPQAPELPLQSSTVPRHGSSHLECECSPSGPEHFRLSDKQRNIL
ncbi:hypothetical protein MHUMG1_01852 [Metarhizium humberi]|uniref:Uncharacterized protein n=1 Tax=Metarhizium humberi TaxID=2596975 RepID=A0A9P8MIA9_9HYPO|nr:hypothetical protein MHUMG1_01852 [Metarhizium humberi]